MSYASRTQVPVDRSKTEIERILVRYGAEGFGYLSSGSRVMIEFAFQGKRIRFLLQMPKREECSQSSYEQGSRQKWRALTLILKAKLEAVESDITTFEEEFLAHVVLPSGKTFGEQFIPQIEDMYASGKVPQLSWDGK